MSDKITVEITEADIKEQLVKNAIGWEMRGAVSDALRCKNMEPLIRDLVKEKVKEALKDIDLEQIKVKAANMIECQLRNIAKKLVENIPS